MLHAGTRINAMVARAGFSLCKVLTASINMSMPLLRYSLRPAVAKRNVFLENDFPVNAEATSSNLSRAFLRTESYSFLFGTNASSKPLGVMKGRISSNCSHSLAVTLLTVVKQSALWAAAFSSECFDCMFNSAAIWSPL